ncbi:MULTISPECIES: ATPase [Sporomusa]|jgi:vacuolar-type H+-ATPase subunit H|uniref:ATPase n=1 Tax=Sporomusa TaxID=2375 RepID=UPI00166B371B|nr:MULTISPECIES: ATPase [Sporomusa]MCM0760253.1 ATPase [Sporomusa sphaeroides DSM 2875]
MTIEKLLDDMETLLVEAARVPFTNKRVIEEDDLAKFLDDLRELMPKELDEAKHIIAERQRILDEAQKEAQSIVEQAKTYCIKLTDENLINKQAQEQANELVMQARKTAKDLQSDAVSYADEVFKHVLVHLERTLDVVQQGHRELQQNQKSQDK